MSQKINIKDQLDLGNIVLDAMRTALQKPIKEGDTETIHDQLKNGKINPLNFYLGCTRAALAFTGGDDIQLFLFDLQRGLTQTEVDHAVESYYQQQKSSIEKQIGERATADLKVIRNETPRPPIDIDNLPLSERPPRKSPEPVKQDAKVEN